ncbi:MAG: hypothetical protein IJZ16_13720 [Clostridia bacterium]|nr:hypothetical protein [Clostridia bacterium]
MKTKVLSLNVDASMSFARFQARLESSIKPFVTEEHFLEFTDIREMFVALQDALANDELVITAVDVRNYLKFKNALIQAFGTDVVYNPTVLNKIESTDLNDKKKKGFSIFPEPATVFVSEDGLYSGMVMENGSQYLVLLPIDNDRIDYILRNGLVPYLSERIATENSFEVPVTQSPVAEKVAVAVNTILESNSLVAVNGTRNAEVLKSCGDSVEGFNKAFVFTPYVEDKGNINPTEYTAQLARASLDLSSANIGACISDIYEANELKYICIAVSKDDTAIVRKLYIGENETENELVESAALELIELVAEKASGQRSVGIEITDENAITEDDKKISKKKPLAILAIVVGIAIIVCAVIGILFQNQKNGGIKEALGSLFKTEESTTQESTTAPPPTETATKAAEVQTFDPALLKLSDFLVQEIMNMSEAEIAQKMTAVNNKAPEYITVNGEKIEPKIALARLIAADYSSGVGAEAVKAQVVAAYSCLKFLDNGFNIEGVRIAESYSSLIMDAVDEVYGEYLTYNNSPAFPIYHSLTAGATYDVAGKLPYIKSYKTENSLDYAQKDYNTEKIYSADSIKEILLKYDSSMSLSENPAEWLVITSHNQSVSGEVGYVETISVNGTEMTGIEFRMKVMGAIELPSLCFTITYDDILSRYIIKSYGQGYGAGMSLFGAKKLASDGKDYKAILATYYEGTTLSEEVTV